MFMKFTITIYTFVEISSTELTLTKGVEETGEISFMP
jgi:hypothetical protein